MKEEFHRQAFEERKETIFRWAIDVRGLENSQHTIGDNTSKAICEQLSYGAPKPLGKLREALELVKNHPSIDGWHDVTTSCAFLSTQNSTGLRDQWNICCFKSLEKELRAMLRW